MPAGWREGPGGGDLGPGQTCQGLLFNPGDQGWRFE